MIVKSTKFFCCILFFLSLFVDSLSYATDFVVSGKKLSITPDTLASTDRGIIKSIINTSQKEAKKLIDLMGQNNIQYIFKHCGGWGIFHNGCSSNIGSMIVDKYPCLAKHIVNKLDENTVFKMRLACGWCKLVGAIKKSSDEEKKAMLDRLINFFDIKSAHKYRLLRGKMKGLLDVDKSCIGTLRSKFPIANLFECLFGTYEFRNILEVLSGNESGYMQKAGQAFYDFCKKSCVGNKKKSFKKPSQMANSLKLLSKICTEQKIPLSNLLSLQQCKGLYDIMKGKDHDDAFKRLLLKIQPGCAKTLLDDIDDKKPKNIIAAFNSGLLQNIYTADATLSKNIFSILKQAFKPEKILFPGSLIMSELDFFIKKIPGFDKTFVACLTKKKVKRVLNSHNGQFCQRLWETGNTCIQSCIASYITDENDVPLFCNGFTDQQRKKLHFLVTSNLKKFIQKKSIRHKYKPVVNHKEHNKEVWYGQLADFASKWGFSDSKKKDE